MTTLSSKRLYLWPEGAPGALGNDPEDRPGITPYLLTPSDRRACIVICPGGGYHHRAAHEGEPVARWVNNLGIAAVVLDYRVAPYRHPYPLLDAQRAIRLVRHHASEWGIDPSRVGVLGFSAGGHLASTLGTHYDSGNHSSIDPVERFSSRPDLMILCYPVISFTEHRHLGSIRNLLGPEPPEDLLLSLSNERQVTQDTPPTFLWHTANDPGVPVENSLMFAKALSANEIPFELHVYPSGRHGLGLAAGNPHISTWTELCSLFLAHRGFTSS